jgi:type I restriction enzyme, R subunit
VRQARDDFFAYHPPGVGARSRSFSTFRRSVPGIEESATIVISTVECVYATLTGRALLEDEEEQSAFEVRTNGMERVVSYNAAIPIETFDLVIIDECHPSIYSTSRQVLAYFHAFVIGLTAARSPQTLGFFNNNLVAQYPDWRSVADGVTVPYEVYRIRAETGAQGGEAAKACEQPMGDRRTCAQELSGTLRVRWSVKLAPSRRQRRSGP